MTFVAYGVSHWSVLTLFILVAWLLIHLGRGWRKRGEPRGFSRLFALLILIFQLPFQVYSMLPPQWDLHTSLPFHLCDLAWMIAVIALWTHNRLAFALIYYWGLSLSSQALLTPQLTFDFPHLQFLMFWGGHCLVVWAAIYLTWGLGFGPGWREYGITVVVTLVWIVLMLGFNSLTGSNYLYLSARPTSPTLLDLFGDWPWYLLISIGLGLLVWAMMTLPWLQRGTGRTTGGG